jgi:hypothetical protein
MLGVSSYTQDYVDHCRESVRRQVSAYTGLAAAARGGAAGDVEGAIDEFEPRFFNGMVLCDSLLQNDGVLAADKQIKLRPDASVLGLAVGDEIRIGQEDFVRLAEAFFAEIEKRFVATGVPA